MRLASITLGTTALALLASFTTEMLHAPISVLGQLFRLIPIENRGIAFGVHLGTLLQSTLICFALAIVLWNACKSPRTILDDWGYGLLIGGALSNVLDRLWDGAVEDIFSIGSFPVFNIADTAITIGVLLLLWPTLKKLPRSQKI